MSSTARAHALITAGSSPISVCGNTAPMRMTGSTRLRPEHSWRVCFRSSRVVVIEVDTLWTVPRSRGGRFVSQRIPPVAENDWPDDIRPALDRLAGERGRPLNVFRTLANHPRLFLRWLGLGEQLLDHSTLPPRLRELVILRTATLAGSSYEWAHHTVIGRSAGLSEDEIARVREGPDAAGWSDTDLAVLRAVDELYGG